MTTVLFHSIRHTQYLETTDASCKTYSDFDVFKYNYFVWCITFFFIGCQWTHINELAPGFTLTPASIKTWKKGSWAIFLALIIAIVVIIHAVWKVYKVSGVLNLYVTYIFAVVGYMVYKTCKSHQCKDKTLTEKIDCAKYILRYISSFTDNQITSFKWITSMHKEINVPVRDYKREMNLNFLVNQISEIRKLLDL